MLFRFLVRWLVCILGLYIAAGLLGHNHLSLGDSWLDAVGAGFVLAIVNMVVKPVLVILSIPALVLSLGLFLIIINGVVILIASWLDQALFVENFGVAILAGLIMGLVNFLAGLILESI
ncbi:MAG TPA: phage holin family protein [Candidatus Saccharimonadales bacterium]|nr:phage holin family protein [Candidatus Saccharimonadales bacterium]